MHNFFLQQFNFNCSIKTERRIRLSFVALSEINNQDKLPLPVLLIQFYPVLVGSVPFSTIASHCVKKRNTAAERTGSKFVAPCSFKLELKDSIYVVYICVWIGRII